MEAIENKELDMELEMEQEVTHTQAFTVYMREVGQIADIQSDEMERLVQMLKNPNEKSKAINRLIEGNLKLVVSIAHKWKNLGVSLEDLVAEGNLMLASIAEKYDETIGKSFATYAQWWINNAMRKAINASKSVRTPIVTENKKRQYDTAVMEFELANDRKPTEQEIEAITGMSSIIQRNVRTIDNAVISMNQKVDNSEGEQTEIGDMIADKTEDSFVEKMIHSEDIEALKQAVSKLEKRDRDIIVMRYVKNYTLEQIASVIGKTKERSRQLEKEAIGKLRSIFNELVA